MCPVLYKFISRRNGTCEKFESRRKGSSEMGQIVGKTGVGEMRVGEKNPTHSHRGPQVTLPKHAYMQ